ncbi:MAG: magnesium transporter CorA family protein [Candidatus Firestonebacteria bacterium]|nr:magnesium transporter CorA family protein [Candidatus Firestonebacteria bacterium]
MIKKYSVTEGRLVEAVDQPALISIYVDPDENEKKYLISEKMINEHTIQSSLDPHELGRIEFASDHITLILKTPKNYSSEDDFLFKVKSFGLFVFSDHLILLLADDFPIFESEYFKNITSIQDAILKLINQSIGHFEAHLKVINMVNDELENEIKNSVSNQQLLNMFKLEKSLVFYLNAISSNSHVVDKIKLNAAKFNFTPANLDLLDDLAIENVQCYKMAEIYAHVISGLMDARASLISNNLNFMMKNLNALVIAVAVPSFFAGVGGMSEFMSIFGAKNSTLSYSLFILVMLLTGILTFIIIKKTEKFWKDL